MSEQHSATNGNGQHNLPVARASEARDAAATNSKVPQTSVPSAAEQNTKASRKKAFWAGTRTAVQWVIGVCGALALAAGLSYIWVINADARATVVGGLVLVVLLGVYPIAYLAYLGFGAEAKRARLKDDFRLFGLVSDEDLDETINKLYNNLYSLPQFLAYIILIVAVSALIIASYDSRAMLMARGVIDAHVVELIFYGYLGAYVFSVQELVRRYNTFDLQPQVYSSILSRLLITLAIAFVLGKLIVASGGQFPGGQQNGTQFAASAWEIIIIFVVGVFPNVGLRWFVQQAGRVLSSQSQQSDELPLNNLLGVSTWHEARFSIMGIDDAQNLATADIPRILLTTQFDTQQVANWIDQAILYVKVGSRIGRFREAKITTFSEFLATLDSLSDTLPGAPAANGSSDETRSKSSLSTILGLTDPNELWRLADYSNYPNYNNIAHYYEGAAKVGRQRAESSVLKLTGAGALDRNLLRNLTDPDEKTDLKKEREVLLRQLHGLGHDPELYTKLGAICYQLKKVDEAQAYFTKALEIDPNYAEAYYGRSFVYLDDHNQDVRVKAIWDLTKAIEIRPSYAEAYNERGEIFIQMKDYERAIQDLNKAIALDQRLAVAYYNRAAAYNAQGRLSETLAELEKAYLLGYEQAGLWYIWGVVLLAKDDYMGAIEKLSQAIYRNSRLEDAYANRGNAYLNSKGPLIDSKDPLLELARTDHKMAIKLNPQLVDSHSKLGNIAFLQKKYIKAAEAYNAALAIDKTHINSLLNLAKTYINLKELDNAFFRFQQLNNLARQTPFSESQKVELENLAKQLELSADVLEEYETSLKRYRDLDDKDGIAQSLRRIARFHEQRGEFTLAQQTLEEAQEIYKGMNNADQLQSIADQLNGIKQRASDITLVSTVSEQL